MNLIEIADNEYINVEKYFAFELFAQGTAEESVTVYFANSVTQTILDNKSGLALRDYLLSSTEKQQWVYINHNSTETILNTEQISKLEFAKSHWLVGAGEHLGLHNRLGLDLGFNEDDLMVVSDNFQMKPTSFMKIKAALNPLDISVED